VQEQRVRQSGEGRARQGAHFADVSSAQTASRASAPMRVLGPKYSDEVSAVLAYPVVTVAAVYQAFAVQQDAGEARWGALVNAPEAVAAQPPPQLPPGAGAVPTARRGRRSARGRSVGRLCVFSESAAHRFRLRVRAPHEAAFRHPCPC